MYEHTVERRIKETKFQAILHGADPKELEDVQETKVPTKDNLLFGDPAEYEKMSDEERKTLSDSMMKKFSRWAGAKK